MSSLIPFDHVAAAVPSCIAVGTLVSKTMLSAANAPYAAPAPGGTLISLDVFSLQVGALVQSDVLQLADSAANLQCTSGRCFKQCFKGSKMYAKHTRCSCALDRAYDWHNIRLLCCLAGFNKYSVSTLPVNCVHQLHPWGGQQGHS